MKTILLLLMLSAGVLSNAQIDDKNKFKKNIFFNVDLKNHDSLQLFHTDFKREIPYMIRGKISGGNFLGIRRYSIKNIEFVIENIPLDSITQNIEDSKMYIKSIDFKCFVDKYTGKCEENRTSKKSSETCQPKRKSNRIAKFKIVVTNDASRLNDCNREDYTKYNFDTNLFVFKEAIFDFEIEEFDNEKESPFSIKEKDMFNFGGHICKVLLSY